MGAGPEADGNGGGGLTVAVLGDDEALREATAGLVGRNGFTVAIDASEVEELDVHDFATTPDCIVVLEAGDAATGTAIRDVRRAFPTSAIVCITESVARRVVVEKLDAGADGIVLLEQLEGQLSTAVRAVCSGQLSLPRELRSWFEKPRLSPREKQVLSMVVLGFTNREIANKLFLAESTIKSHLSSAFEKLGVRSRSDAAALILDSTNGLGTGILSILEEEAAVASPAP